MNPVKTVSLVYGYSARNAGDFAITLGAIDVLLSFGIKVKLFLDTPEVIWIITKL